MDVVKLAGEGDMERHSLPAAESRASWTVLFLRHKHRSIENTIPAAGRRFSRFSPLFPPRETDLQKILPPSRRGKPFFERFFPFPAAGNRFSENFSHFPPREGVFRRFFPISRRGKAFLKVSDRFPAAGRRFWKSEIGFASHFCVSEIPRSFSRLIFAFQKFHDRPRVV